MSPEERKLTWPPLKEDLERLYLEEKLSAAKIAAVYGLNYASPKTAESTVLYHLKRNGVSRRGRADHIRKVTMKMVDEWVQRYQNGESLKSIGGKLVNPVTVFTHLGKRGLKLRDKEEAKLQAITKYAKTPFDGTDQDRWYLIGLRYGDLHVVSHGRAIRVRVSTTHRAMAELFESLFQKYGHVGRYPRRAKLTGYEWTFECDLDQSFSFLKYRVAPSQLVGISDEHFLGFLSGFFDAEGSVSLHRKYRRHNPEATVTNADSEILGLICKRLRAMGFETKIKWRDQPPNRSGISGNGIIGRLEVTRFREAQRLVSILHLRHTEKTKKSELISRMKDWIHDDEQAELFESWDKLISSIGEDRDKFVGEARAAVELKESASYSNR